MNEDSEMWFGKNKKIQLVILLTIFIIPVLTETKFNQAENPDPYFSISVLAPNTYGYTYATLMVEQLPKIGIAVDIYDYTGWYQISERTWDYPGPYPIPSYSEGGFDILCLGFSYGLDVDLTELFHSVNITPNKWNFYQYDRPEMDWALGNYSQAFVLADRIQYAHDIQALLYEDVPQATISYPQEVFPHDPNMVASSWTPLLWATSYEDIANWEIPGQTEFWYATPADFVDFHPMQTGSVFDAQWTSQIYGGLLERTPVAPYNNAYGVYACTSFSSANGINSSVEIDPNLVFADGAKCNATDVKYSYDLLINPDFGQPDYNFFSQYIDDKTIEIISEYEVKANFLQAYVFQDSNLGIDILPYHIWKDVLPEDQESQAVTWATNNTLDSNLMGIGPYYLHDYDGTNDIIHLKANPYWADWGDHTTQKFTDVYFDFYSNKWGALSALAAGVVDMVDSQFSTQLLEVPGTADYTLVTVPEYKEMAFNCKHPYLGTGELCPISDPDSGKYIRQAISHLVPRDVIISEIYNGIGSPGVTAYPEGAIGFDESLKPYEYNISLALAHMKLAGFDVNWSNVGSSVNVGLGLETILGILAFIGGSIHLIIKTKRKKKRFRNEE